MRGILLLCILLAVGAIICAPAAAVATTSENVSVTNGTTTYPAYVATPIPEGEYPGIVLLHSFNGLEPGYEDLTDRLASEGFVVITPAWQAFNQSPDDAEVEGVVRGSLAYLEGQPRVNESRFGLTGFCAGGRYTMLFLPTIEEFDAGVAFYGFPFSGGFANGTPPADVIDRLEAPMLIIHGSADQASNVSDIYRYAEALDAAGKYFELKVYQGEPHGFLVENGTLQEDFAGRDAYREMATFFNRTLAVNVA